MYGGGALAKYTVCTRYIPRVSQNHTYTVHDIRFTYGIIGREITTYMVIHVHIRGYIYIHGLHTVYLAGRSPHIQSYTVYTYGSSQP